MSDGRDDLSADAGTWEDLRGRLGLVLDAADIGVWRLHLPTRLATWDSVAARVIGGDAGAQDAPAPLPIHPDDLPIVAERLKLLEAGVGERALTVRIVRSDGTVRWIRASARRPAGLDQPVLEWVVGLVSDVTSEKEGEAAILEGKRQLATLMDHLPGVAYRCELREPWRMTYLSEGVRSLTGLPSDEFTSGRRNWADLMHPDDVSRIAKGVGAAIKTGKSFDLTYRITSADGVEHWVQERGRAYYEDEEPRFLEGFIWDVSAAREAQEQTRWIANHDALTGLPNRLLFQETVDAMSATRTRSDFVILLLDVDDFKRTNDTLGHEAGDRLLSEFAKRLLAVVGANDFVARLGGDEFAIVLAGVADEEAVISAGEQILNELGAPLENDVGLLTCTASIGAAIHNVHANSRTELLKYADIALYAAKAAGRSNLKLFTRSMLDEIQARSSMLRRAERALDDDEILPFYQPKIALRSGEVAGFEALLRLRSPTGTLALPQEISSAFEDPVLAIQLGERMVDAVLGDIRKWIDAGVAFGHVAINASSAQFRRGDFGEKLLAKLADRNIAPELLQVEVTETVFLGRGSRFVEQALTTLDKAGVRIALDDFGTGYASLLHLAEYPVRMLKIDRSFVARMVKSQHDDAIVKAVVSLGHSLGMQVVAEGVETLAQEARLRATGCDFAQGFFYAPALSFSEVPKVLTVRGCAHLG